MDPSQPNPLLSLIISVVMGVFDLLAAFNIVPLSESQKTAVISVTTLLFGLGVYLYVWLKQQGWVHLNHMKLERERIAAAYHQVA